MIKKQINDLKNDLLSLQLTEYLFITNLNLRQTELLYSQKYSYVRHYISWLSKNGRSIFEIAFFVRPEDNLIASSYVRFYNNARSRFSHKLAYDFISYLTFEEFRWLCANINYFL